MRLHPKRENQSRCIFHLVLLLGFVILGVAPAWAIVVTSTADSGAGSLRQAITNANTNAAGADIITFDPTVFPPPPALPGTITLLSALPNLTGPGDTIDGTGAGVALDGTNLAAGAAAGLRVRASNVTIHGLTFMNFTDNDAIVVEGRNATPVVLNAMISGNSFFSNGRGVRIDGGIQTANTTVSASILDNILQENTRGIFVRGNGTGSDGGNTVSVLIDGNLVQGKTINPDDAGSGINIQGGSDIGSFNTVTAIITNNTVTQIRNDGIVANGCTANAIGSNNTVNATITANNVKFNRNLPPSDLFNNGIIITGATGETGETSFCSFNTISFLVSENNVSGFKTINITVGGGDEGTSNNTVQGTVLANHVSGADGRGIQVSGGTGNNHSVDVLISENISNSNGLEGIRVTAGTAGNGNVVSLAGVVNNTASRNGGDGIGIRSNIPGINGGTPVNGNRTDRNGEDGIDINSTGYVLSSNRALWNTADGINAVGNVDDGGNVSTHNASCNTPGCY